MESLINELKQGRELARQLQVHINAPSSTHENRELLIHRILSSYEKAIDLVKGSLAVASVQQSTGMAVGMSESPRSRSGSPHSEDSDREFKDVGTGDASRKRKSMPRWTKQIQVCPGTGLEGPLDDGFSWRKYGQKDILGAKYPRGYYRCTHRHVQGCLATKQVQRSDEDPTIFEVTYRGTHTCNQVSELNPTSGPADKPETSKQGNHKQVITQPKQTENEILINFQRDLKVETNLDTHHQQHQNFPIFNFPSALPTEQESSPYHFSVNMSPPFMSPSTTTGSNYFSGMQNLYLSEPEFTSLISAPASTTNSPTVGMDFPFSQTGFDPNFTFDNSGFFP